jgi:hypothetical protein
MITCLVTVEHSNEETSGLPSPFVFYFNSDASDGESFEEQLFRTFTAIGITSAATYRTRVVADLADATTYATL